MKPRNHAIDIAKGVLILFVIAGHTALGGPDTFIHYFIYSFHMPLFVAVSGYVTNWETLRDLPGSALVKKYGTRLFMPWIFAIVVYWLLTKEPLLPPYFHLWYISAYLSWIVLSRILAKAGLTIATIFVLSLIISLTGAYIYIHPYTVPNPPFHLLVHTLLATFRPDLFIFFVLGACLKQYKPRLPILLTASVAAAFLIGQLSLYFYPQPALEFVSSFLFPISIALLLQSFIEKSAGLSNPFLEWVGRNSLGIYLWHVLPLLAVFPYLNDRPIPFYLCVTGLELLLFGFIWITSRIAFIRKYFYGLP